MLSPVWIQSLCPSRFAAQPIPKDHGSRPALHMGTGGSLSILGSKQVDVADCY